jgi:hypothetical protein
MYSDALANFHFDELQKHHKVELDIINKYKEVNNFLRLNDWLFVCPLFFQGYELNYFFELSKRNEPAKLEILKAISAKFYNLNWTTSFVDGYCSRCNHINPFARSIENSIILAFQKDYEGGIKTLIPVVEGIIRKYLTTEKGFNNDNIGFYNIKTSIEFLYNDLIEIERTELLNYHDQNNTNISFSESQIEELLKFHIEYYKTWFSFISDFFENSLYLSTKSRKIKNQNEVNRYSILHELGYDFDYNFENYIKVFFVILFLTWIFLMKENKSILSQIDTKTFINKIISYKNIIEKSERLDYDKHVLLSGKKDYKDETLRIRIKPIIDLPFKKWHWWFIKVDRWINEFIWRKNGTG